MVAKMKERTVTDKMARMDNAGQENDEQNFVCSLLSCTVIFNSTHISILLV